MRSQTPANALFRLLHNHPLSLIAAVLLLLLRGLPPVDATFEPALLYDDLAPTLRGDTPTVLILLAPWCAACRSAAPVVAALGAAASADGAALTVGVVDTDEEPGVAPKFGVTAFPTILFFPPAYVLPRGKAKAPPPVTYAPREGDASPRPPPPSWPVAFGDHRQAPLVAAWANAHAASTVWTVAGGPAYDAWLASVGGVLPPTPAAQPVAADGGTAGAGVTPDAPVYLDKEGGAEVKMELDAVAPAAWSATTFWSSVAGHTQALALWGAAAEGSVPAGMASALMGGTDGPGDGWVVGLLADPPGVGEPAGGAAVVDVSGGCTGDGNSVWGAADVQHCGGWGFAELFDCINNWAVHRATVAAAATEGGVAANVEGGGGEWLEDGADGGAPEPMEGANAFPAAVGEGPPGGVGDMKEEL